jgi:Threonine dehydrogenase and related Zn-dependent dehydrogenases
MRAARYHGRENIQLEDIENQTLSPEQVRLTVDTGGICGSDLHEYTAGSIFVSGESSTPSDKANSTSHDGPRVQWHNHGCRRCCYQSVIR